MKIRLRFILIIPFILLNFGTVAFVGYLSYSNGKKAVENLANELMNQASNRISDHVHNVIAPLQSAVRANGDILSENLLNINDRPAIQKYLYTQLRMSPIPFSTFFIDKNKNYIGYFRVRTQIRADNFNQLSGKNDVKVGTIILEKVEFDEVLKGKFYLVDNQGNPVKLLSEFKPDLNYPIFYSLKAKEQDWLPITSYQAVKTPELAAVFPVYDANAKIQGAFYSARTLASISQFLKDLKISPSGQSFILETFGDLVATSKPEKIYIEDAQGNLTRLSGSQSQNTWIRETSLELQRRFSDFQAIPDNYFLRISLKNQTLLVHINHYKDQYGLNWLLVTVIPDSDFMQEIRANTNQTILLCVLTLLISMIISSLIARWITEPILRLNRFSELLAQEKWESSLIDNEPIVEINNLFQSFNWMSNKIQESFSHLNLALQQITELYQEREKYTHMLEEKVKERTLELYLVNQELAKIAHLDGLTHIPNRRSFDQYLAQEWNKHLKEQTSVSLLLIDIDYFKLYNDFYGHQCGDNCIIQVAQTMAQVVTESTGLVARYGGEEFVSILPHTHSEGALGIAQHIQQAIDALKIHHAQSKVSQYVTLSIGVATMIPQPHLNAEDLIKQADQALYAAKQQGRNQIVVKNCLTTQGQAHRHGETRECC